ncbi:NAD(P)-dependent alcohol dehydrogenase [Microbacterium sp.]|uniref:NAD(P)-dependent alcohol dehydrogenase n=1 Tax=Microbacterium sp. TaxID=51671 RepID=UPI003F9844FB
MPNLAAVMPELGYIEVRDVGEPELSPRGAIVQIEAVGVCGSDASYFTVGYVGDWIVDGPIILGHECAGTVVRIGGDVTSVAIGDRVAIEPGRPCRDCEECAVGRYHLCPGLVFFATPPHDGSLVQRMAIDERQLFALPDDMSYEEGALCEPLSVGIWACRRAQLEPGDRVLITGAGPVGLLAAQVARAFGARTVTVADVSMFRLDVARKLGFGTERVGDNDNGDFDVLLECSGAPTALADGLRRLRGNGRAAMVGMPKQEVGLALSRLNANELTISLVNRYAHTWPTAVDLVASGRVDVASLVTHRFPLDRTADAIMLPKHVPDSVKAVITPQELSA